MNEQSWLSFINPATQENFGQMRISTPQEVELAREELRTAAKFWAARPLSARIRILRQLQEVMIEAQDEISAVINKNTGKSRQDALIELLVTIDNLQTNLRHAPRWLRREKTPTGLYLFKRAYVERRPYGVVAIIAPWNYPFALAMPPVLAALLAGNAVMLKPSEVTPAVGQLMEQLFQRVPELAPYVRVLHGGASVGAAVVQSKPDYIFLTGSTQTGRKVLAAAGEHLIPAGAELGGKDAMLVLEDADLQAAAHWGVWGAFYNTGQTCMSVERVYAVAPVYDEFVRLALAQAQSLTMGYSPEKGSHFYLGPITDPRQVKIICRHYEDAVAKGARTLMGGKTQGSYFEPTVLVDVTHDMLVMQEETFGPLLPIMKVADEREAIRRANDCAFGLGASIWSADLARARRVAAQIQASSVIINDTIAQFAVPELPFGGIKDSGFGRTHGREGLQQFTTPYSYLVGAPPYRWDVATLARQPGRYGLISALLNLLFGVTLKQRAQPVVEGLEILQEKAEETLSAPAARKKIPLGIGLLGALSAAVGAALVFKRRPAKPSRW